MDWTKFNNHGESNNHAFEVMCNLLFEAWCKETHKDRLKKFSFVNGDGGDGGVEAYATLTNNEIIAVQSKWFPDKIENSQIQQISNSFKTAITVRPNIKKYIVCIPRDLGSTKVVKNGKKAKKTESDRWNEMISNYIVTNPEVEIILWNETKIQERLTRQESQGIYKYWFENSVIFDNLFKYSYEKVSNGWGKLKYVPEVYTFGYIHDCLERFLGSLELSKRRFEEVSKFIKRLELLKHSYDDLLKLKFIEEQKEFKDTIQNDIANIDDWLITLESCCEDIKLGDKLKRFPNSLGLKYSSSDLKELSFNFENYFHFNEAKKLLENIERDYYELKKLLEEYDGNRIVFLGMQGTGKTAGIIAEAASFIKNRTHLPIIIHAKDFEDGDTWLTMINKTLGLNNDWSEIELFGALQNASFIRNNLKDGFFTFSQCVIIVDGIDESISWKFWKDKIDETITFQNRFPRIKFVFLSRPYVFENRNELSKKNYFRTLPKTGDADLDEICDKYFAFYSIDVGDNIWIKQNLKNTMSVRLFSDIYRNQKIEKLDKNTVVLTELYKAKISSMENLYKEQQNSLGACSVIQAALVELANLFADHKFLEFEEIYDSFPSMFKNSLLDILNFLEKEGFIYTRKEKQDEFSSPKTYYLWGIQPAFDYLIARKMYDSLSSGKNMKIEEVDGIYLMLSLIAIEDGKLITEFNNVEIDDYEAFELIYYALANCSVNTAQKYVDYLMKLMGKSVENFRVIFNEVIKSVLRIDGHPLGAGLLDDFLRLFSNSAERDIWWSIPSFLIDSYNADWRAYSELDFDSIKLTSNDKFSAAPLVLAWTLSSVDNSVRQKSRYKLTEWGLAQPLEFWKLFKKCISIDDMQILEDIFAVAYGIALDQFICDDYLISASNWIIENLFSIDGLKKYENVVLRYYGAGIIKIAISHGLKNSEMNKLITPPYTYESNLLPLCLDAIEAKRIGGYGPIDYDLARYVLCDRFDHFFKKDYKTSEYHSKAKEFIEKYKTKYGLNKLETDGLVISLVYQFLLEQGWNQEKFDSYEDIDNLGVDIAIKGTYHPATHGEMSKIMTVAEKNVWLAKHKIEAVFSNEIPYCEDFRTFQYIDDYSRFENFINPYQDYVNIKHRDETHVWFNDDLLANPDFVGIDKEKIESWMDNNEIPQFEKWFSNNNGNILLNTYTNILNDVCGVEETVWVSSGAVKKENFENFLIELDNDFEDKNEMIDVTNFHAYQDGHCYCSPQEACLIHPEREINNRLIVDSSKSEIEVFKLVEECMSADALETEKSFVFPSKLTRKLTNIVYGDGYSYRDYNGNSVAVFNSYGDKWGTYQETLMINSGRLCVGLDEHNLKMFWLFRVYRAPSSKARECYDQIKHSTDRTFIVWKEEEKFRHKELFDIERFKNQQDIDLSDEINSVLAKYGSSEEVTDDLDER